MKRGALPQKLLVGGLACVLALALCELSLRLVGYSAPIFRQPDDRLGWRGAANLEGWHRLETNNYVRLNSLGYYDREHPRAKPARTTRVALLGDSFLQACEVPPEQHFAGLLEKELGRRLAGPNLKAEVLNFGVTGFGPAQELMLLDQEVRTFQPDIVALFIFVGNDIADSVPVLATSLGDSRPYFEAAGSGLRRRPGYPDLDRVARDRMIAAAVNRLRLLQLLKEAALRRHAWSGGGAAGDPSDLGPGRAVLYDPPAGSWQTAWHVTELLIARIAEQAATLPARFLLVIVPFPIQVHPSQERRLAAAAALEAGNLDYATRRLERFAAARGLPYLSLTQPFQAAAAEGIYLSGFDEKNLGEGHWNKHGHALVSALLAEALSPWLGETVR